jgi:hypothetical protein
MTKEREEERAGRVVLSSLPPPENSVSVSTPGVETETESESRQKQTPDAQEASQSAPASEREHCLEVVRRVLLGEPRPHSLEAAVLAIEEELSA